MRAQLLSTKNLNRNHDKFFDKFAANEFHLARDDLSFSSFFFFLSSLLSFFFSFLFFHSLSFALLHPCNFSFRASGTLFSRIVLCLFHSPRIFPPPLPPFLCSLLFYFAVSLFVCFHSVLFLPHPPTPAGR